MKTHMIDNLIKALEEIKSNSIDINIEFEDTIDEAIEASYDQMLVYRCTNFKIKYKQPITVDKNSFKFLMNK